MGSVKKLAKESLSYLFPGNAPDFLIIGAQKSGTSSLHYYITIHPNIVRGKLKEINFFNEDFNYNKGIKWYESHFKHALRSRKIFFEASPVYLYNKKTPCRIYKYKPEIKLIALLREPVARAFSSWNMYRNFFLNNTIPAAIAKSARGTNGNLLNKFLYHGRTTFPSFSECVDHELKIMKSGLSEDEPSFIRRGMYYSQISEYLKYFSKDQILILGFNELVNEKLSMLNKIEQFLGINHFDYNSARNLLDKIIVSKQKIRYTEKINDSIKSDLTEFYSPWNEKLFELLGRDLLW